MTMAGEVTVIRRRVDGCQEKMVFERGFLRSKLKTMSTTISPASPSAREYTYQLAKRRPSPISRFFTWAANEDLERHIGWVGIMVVAMTVVCFPLTMAVILVNGAVFGLILVAMVSLVLVVITNLAALPTKYTIPFFFLGIAIDVIVAGLSFFLR
jgi:hypothetical protein